MPRKAGVTRIIHPRGEEPEGGDRSETLQMNRYTCVKACKPSLASSGRGTQEGRDRKEEIARKPFKSIATNAGGNET